MNVGFISSGVSGRTFVKSVPVNADKMHNQGKNDIMAKQTRKMAEMKY